MQDREVTPPLLPPARVLLRVSPIVVGKPRNQVCVMENVRSFN